MARYTGPTDKISRRFGIALFGPSKALENRAFPPGQHGPKMARRRKQSDYALMLAEKQKLRMQYGVLEKPFRRLFAEAVRRGGVTGEILIQLLELRLDNVVYRMGLSNSRRGARQLVNHGHILINGVRTDVSSYSCKPGDKVSVHSSAGSKQLALRGLEKTQYVPSVDWVTLDKETLVGAVTRVPERSEVDPQVDEQMVVEFYSR